MDNKIFNPNTITDKKSLKNVSAELGLYHKHIKTSSVSIKHYVGTKQITPFQIVKIQEYFSVPNLYIVYGADIAIVWNGNLLPPCKSFYLCRFGNYGHWIIEDYKGKLYHIDHYAAVNVENEYERGRYPETSLNHNIPTYRIDVHKKIKGIWPTDMIEVLLKNYIDFVNGILSDYINKFLDIEIYKSMTRSGFWGNNHYNFMLDNKYRTQFVSAFPHAMSLFGKLNLHTSSVEYLTPKSSRPEPGIVLTDKEQSLSPSLAPNFVNCCKKLDEEFKNMKIILNMIDNGVPSDHIMSEYYGADYLKYKKAYSRCLKRPTKTYYHSDYSEFKNELGFIDTLGGLDSNFFPRENSRDWIILSLLHHLKQDKNKYAKNFSVIKYKSWFDGFCHFFNMNPQDGVTPEFIKTRDRFRRVITDFDRDANPALNTLASSNLSDIDPEAKSLITKYIGKRDQGNLNFKMEIDKAYHKCIADINLMTNQIRRKIVNMLGVDKEYDELMFQCAKLPLENDFEDCDNAKYLSNVKNLKKSKIKFTQLLTQEEFTREGVRMSHCVGSYYSQGLKGTAVFFHLVGDGSHTTLAIYFRTNGSVSSTSHRGYDNQNPIQSHKNMAESLVSFLNEYISIGNYIRTVGETKGKKGKLVTIKEDQFKGIYLLSRVLWPILKNKETINAELEERLLNLIIPIEGMKYLMSLNKKIEDLTYETISEIFGEERAKTIHKRGVVAGVIGPASKIPVVQKLKSLFSG